jgi:threonine synthase
MLRFAAVNSINWARILAQITYCFASYFSLIRSGRLNPSTNHIRFIIPTRKFGDILAGYFEKANCLLMSNLIIAENVNGIIYCFWKTGAYEKHTVHSTAAEGGLIADGFKARTEDVEETLSPAVDILVSSNFERRPCFIAYDVYGADMTSLNEKRQAARLKVKEWQTNLKTKGGFSVEKKALDAAKADFVSERVSDAERAATTRDVYR